MVDDEAQIRVPLAAYFETVGWTVVQCESASEAVEHRDLGTFDVVLSDVRMPGMNGYELARFMTRHHPNIAVVLLSGYAELPDEVIDGVAFVIKPIPPRELVDRLREQVSLQHANGVGRTPG